MDNNYSGDKIFTEKYQVRFYDVDCNYYLKPDTILAWAGELAGDHLRSRDITREDLWERGQVFLLTRCVMKYNKTPVYRDFINMNTWENGTKGVQFNRYYDITDEKGNVMIQAHSLWVLVNPYTHKILRPKEYAYEMCKTDRNIDLDIEKRTYEQGVFAGKYTFHYTDLDANGHVNNGAYVRIAQNFSPTEMRKFMIDELDITFIKEAMQGDEINIYHKQLSENIFQVYGEFSDKKHSFEAQITVKPLTDL